MINISPIEIWLVIGVICILIEFTAVPGIGFLFLGLGSMSNAVLIYHYPELANYQIAAVGLISLAWFLILWWPLKIFVYGRKGEHTPKNYFDLIGSQVKVCDKPLEPGNVGLVSWSGTRMNATLKSTEKTSAKVDQVLYVVEVKGNILICSSTK